MAYDDGFSDVGVVVVGVNGLDEIAVGFSEFARGDDPWCAGGVEVVPDLVFFA